MFRIAACNAEHVADVGGVHADEVVVGFVVPLGHLDGTVWDEGDAHLAEFGYGAMVGRVADFFAAGGGGIDLELGGEV